MTKEKIAALLAAVLLFGIIGGTSAMADNAAKTDENSAAQLIEDIPTVQAFTADPVAAKDIEAIVNAGVNAPSAMNSQPWHFSVITDKAVLEKIAGDMGGGMPKGSTPPSGSDIPADAKAPDGATPPSGGSFPSDAKMPEVPTASGTKAGIADAPMVIIISCKEGSELDAGLAAQNMSAEAQLLGYGSKIISSPKMAINGANQAEYKELLGIPEDMSAVCMLLVGMTDTENFDVVSGATTRNAVDDLVSFIK